MIIKDNIYGKTEIKEPVLRELLVSRPLLRLKDISQYGVPDKYYHLKGYSRYEHSIGVMFLLKKLGASIEEQVAGLLHDVSQTAFSHVADWVFDEGKNGKEDFHHNLQERFVRQTPIGKILEKHDFSIERILNENNFSLLERKSPDLCADRVDYGLREFKYWCNSGVVENCVNDLINFNGEIVFRDQKSAFDFATNFLELQTKHWGGYEAVTRYYLFSYLLKLAMQKKIISQKYFLESETPIIRKIEDSKDEKIQQILTILKQKKLPKNGYLSGEKIIKKFRYVDPKVVIDGETARFAEINKNFCEILKHHKEINERGLFIGAEFYRICDNKNNCG